MPDKENQIIFPQVPEDQLENTIQQRFAHLPDKEDLLSLPLFRNLAEATFHSYLPSLSFQELIHIQVKSRYFRWVNRGRRIGIEVNREYALRNKENFLKYKQYFEHLQKQMDIRTRYFKNLLDELEDKKLAAEKTKELNSVYKNNLLSIEKEKELYNEKLKILNELLDISNKTQKEHFIEITSISKSIALDTIKDKVALTYSFPKKFYKNQTAQPFKPHIIEQFKRILKEIPYVEFIFVDEEKENIKAALRIVQNDKMSSENSERPTLAETNVYHIFLAEPALIQLAPLPPEETINIFLRQLMLALGVPNHWNATAAIDEEGKFKIDIKPVLGNNVNTIKFLKDSRKQLNTTFSYTLPDHCNEASNSLRVSKNLKGVKNQTIRAISGAILSTMYHLKDPYPNGVCFKFAPELGKLFYSTKIKTQKDGSQIVIYSGRCSNITLSNPGEDFTDFDFTDVPAFPLPPSGFYPGTAVKGTYPNGARAYFGPDANITFYASDGFPNDKNISIDLSTKNIRRIFLSKNNDYADISSMYKKVEIHPGPGKDHIRTFANNTTVVVGKYEDFDLIEMLKGGTIILDYKQDDLRYYYRDNHIYLLASKKGAPKAVHGICLKNYKTNRFATSIVIKDSTGRIIDLTKKSFTVLSYDSK